MSKWTIEPHGDGFALYLGRDDDHHGLNLLQITRVDGVRWEKVKPMIESAPELATALQALLALCEGSHRENPKMVLDRARAALAKAGVE